MATPEIAALQDQANVVEWLRDLQRASEAELAELLVKMEACHQQIRSMIFEIGHPTTTPSILGIKKERLKVAEETPTQWAETAAAIREEHKESLNFDVDSYQFPENVPENIREELRSDFKLSQEIQRAMVEICEKKARGEECAETWEEFQAIVNKLALEKFGVEYGIPLPSMHSIERPLIVAKGAPLHHVTQNWMARTEIEQELVRRHIPVRNSWTQLGDMDIAIVDTGGQIEGIPRFFPWPKYHAGMRLRKLLDTTLMRSGTSQTAESEFKAMEALKKRINGRQWESYVLNGVFPELSKRSDLHYFFRKGYPTLAVSYHQGFKEGAEGGRVLAALCLHPLGYYQATHCGLMCPTDEVICHLMMMRADEHAYWKNCGQWSVTDPRSGL